MCQRSHTSELSPCPGRTRIWSSSSANTRSTSDGRPPTSRACTAACCVRKKATRSTTRSYPHCLRKRWTSSASGRDRLAPHSTRRGREEDAMSAQSWNRREILKGVSAATLVGVHAGPAAAQAVKWSAGTETPKLKAPANATDCHHHVYNAKYPVDPRSTLRPGDALVEDDTVSTEELKRMHGLGVRGIRFNLAQAGATTPEMMEPLSKRVNDLGWHIQINAPAAKIMEIMPILERVPSPIVFDHLAHIPQPDGVNHPLYAKVRALMDKGRTWVKLSGAYADTKVGPPSYSDSSAVARAYAKAMPERCVWGSDWPHPSEQSKHLPDDAVLFDLLSDWVPDAKVRHRVLVENPAILYDFPKG